MTGTEQVALITGGAQGIGAAIARRLADEGYALVIADMNGEAAQAFAQELSGVSRATSVACDVVSLPDVEAAVAHAVDNFGRLDVMVNNAGITRDATLRKMTEDQFDEVIAVHLRGCWNGIRAAESVMRPQQSGSIINMSSISAKVGFFGQTNYSAAKSGIVGLTKAAAKELARYGIRVNALQPGLMRTAMTDAMSQEIWESKLKDVPMGRAGEPSEVASVAAFLAGSDASYLTGAVIEVTGGRYM
jgi:3-oxoacyl-[acyl-carrier protein] reductase